MASRGDDMTNAREPVRVNLGCGHVRPDGWLNYDSSVNSYLQGFPLIGTLVPRLFSTTSYERPARYLDIRKRWPFQPASVSLIYASHVLEHLRRSEAERFFEKAKSALERDGRLRVVVPDLQALARRYLESVGHGDRSSADRFLADANLHLENTYGSRFLAGILGWLQGYPHQHKYMYDALSLTALMEKAGFREIRICGYGQSELIPEIREVENTEEGVPSVYVECLR